MSNTSSTLCQMLEKMTGINPAASEYEIDATVREEDASVVPDLSYYDEHIYSKFVYLLYNVKLI